VEFVLAAIKLMRGRPPFDDQRNRVKHVKIMFMV